MMKVIPLTPQTAKTLHIPGGLDLHNLEEVESSLEEGVVLDFLDELGLEQMEED